MQFLYGEFAKEIPENFAPPEAWEDFGTVMYPPKICAREEVPGGIRWSLWPLTFEQYIGDEEPDLELSKKAGALARNRVAAWRRVRGRQTKPGGWMQFSKKPWRIDGYHKLESGDYLTAWQKNARRDARLWREALDTLYAMEEIPLEEFKSAYFKSTVAKKFGTSLLDVFERKMELPQVLAQVKLWGARNLKTKAIIAGTAAHYSAKNRSSVRECPFILPEARQTFAMTGLVDHWFAHSQKNGTELLLFTCFWQKGEPRGWQGFSEFKSHFGLQYVAYPPLLMRFIPGKFF
ncbi:MAG: hypothetical protein UY78_C0006G0009 [Parcubacteria group bacterium GW2011_GWA1_53_13]|uniref:Uncharacterized protein n=2 Tax=Candidatus Adleribacteriota TaxID=1752736 RepID=A0A1F4XZ27_9BACT|nr:MAG: hypothetical protein UY78_C0006G0009 [Parcubacteria group bacterium GW2011_GWA1_53_13]KKW37751.1 MAG: hypothetical protein UY86_C0004G0080 [Candidatus Adlerbacteria bacterium GW2011_GWB1_54_7]OGC79294.1 MAG: hypothetical protein A2852_01435 [Candidatus Adlerbacteria bacterium RIFCSPHIGHO2_01_FULL_54_23]OGC86848.1 MAG: hypothetical protein A3B33_02900 [Candidatus Adlerbacteria bacterium RIFCSPLOWO2_01_FULL_54_16]